MAENGANFNFHHSQAPMISVGGCYSSDTPSFYSFSMFLIWWCYLCPLSSMVMKWQHHGWRTDGSFLSSWTGKHPLFSASNCKFVCHTLSHPVYLHKTAFSHLNWALSPWSFCNVIYIAFFPRQVDCICNYHYECVFFLSKLCLFDGWVDTNFFAGCKEGLGVLLKL